MTADDVRDFNENTFDIMYDKIEWELWTSICDSGYHADSNMIDAMSRRESSALDSKRAVRDQIEIELS